MSHTVVQVPVREAETIVRSRALATRSPYQPQDGGVMAHITLVRPFVAEPELDDGVLAELGDYFADVTTFGFTLTGVSGFPGGPAYLAPEPAGVFRRLTLGLLRLFPEFPPYGGRFGDVVPHLSIPLVPGEDLGTLRRSVDRRLPLECTARTATLVRAAAGDTRTLATFPFGTTAA